MYGRFFVADQSWFSSSTMNTYWIDPGPASPPLGASGRPPSFIPPAVSTVPPMPVPVPGPPPDAVDWPPAPVACAPPDPDGPDDPGPPVPDESSLPHPTAKAAKRVAISFA